MSADWKQMQTHVVPSARSVSPHAFFAVFSFSFYLEFFLHTQGLQSWCYRTQCHSTAIPNVPSGDLKCMDGLIFCNVIHQWLHQRLLLQDMLRVFCAHGWHTASALLLPSWMCLLLQGLPVAVSRTSFPRGGQSCQCGLWAVGFSQILLLGSRKMSSIVS